MENISPGVYMDDSRKTLHLDVPALLHYYGKPDTPANRELISRMAEKVFRARYPFARLEFIDVHL